MSSQVVSREFLNKTSIVLGYQNLNYKTTTNEMNQNCQLNNKNISNDEIESFKKLKDNLRATHFELGDENTSYKTSNTLEDPTGEIEKYTAKLNVHAKALLFKTSAVLGYEKSSYDTCAKDATQWNKDKMIETIQLREKSKKNNDPRKVNYDFGDEKTNYISTAKEEFVYDASKINPSVLADSVKKDLRKCHYTLGNDSTNYETSNHMPDVPVDVMKAAKGTISEETNPWRVNINLTHES